MKNFTLVVLSFFIATANAQEETPLKSETYTIVEEQAEFPGGITEMIKFIRTNIIVPPEVTEGGASGRCFIKFIVTQAGEINNVEVVKGVPNCKECDDAAVKVIKMMPVWTPGKIKGKPVNVYYTVPVKF